MTTKLLFLLLCLNESNVPLGKTVSIAGKTFMVHCPNIIQHAAKGVSKGWSGKYTWKMYVLCFYLKHCVFLLSSSILSKSEMGRREWLKWSLKKQARKQAKHWKINILDLDFVFNSSESFIYSFIYYSLTYRYVFIKILIGRWCSKSLFKKKPWSL